jgi:hypothetical protein
MDHTEKKNEATGVGRRSLLTANGMIRTNKVAAISMTTAINCTKGFRRSGKSR